MKTSILSLIAIAGLGAAPAFAGNYEATPVEPMPVVPMAEAPAPVTGDWTGPYIGLSFGNLNTQAANTDKSGGVYGLYGGYDHDFGRFVLGGELDYQTGNDYAIAGVDVDNVTRLKLRAGYDMGRTMLYGTVGAARIDTSLGDATGPVGGVGLEFKVTDRFTIGGEALAHSFDDIGGSGVDADAQTYSLRASFRF